MLTTLLADKLTILDIISLGFFRNEYISPPCNSSLTTSCIKSAIASSGDQGKVAALFPEGVSSSAEGELTIDENASTVSLAPNVLCPICLWLSKKEECVRDFSDHPSGENSTASQLVLGGQADDNDSFVDIKSGITAVGDAESEGWTFADPLARANFSVETSAKGVIDTSRLLTCQFFFFIAISF